ncbi:MAG: trypsin-like peptidase domain-containing protein [Calditrichaeota bacterium]|nr:trypsin-like peptidase domain-containing protein [Calditrichota bacterium]
MKYLILLSLSMLFCKTVMAGDDLQQQILSAKENVFPALVHIQPVKEFYSAGEMKKVQVTGSGVIISADGYVVTNNHVAEKANYVRCTLSSKEEVQAKVIGLDPWTDLAVLKLDLEEIGLTSVPYAGFGNSDDIDVGQMVMALGSPLGLARSLSLGVISSVDRYFNDVGEMISPFNLWIQTDAAINPGNSGGPLVNLDGEIIGINARAVVFGENLGFAIPANIVKHVVKQIIDKGEVERSNIGVDWQEIKEYRASIGQNNLTGVLIAGIEKDSPAEQAGLKPGDLVTQINGNDVSALHLEELPKIRLMIANIPVNSDIDFTVKTADGNKNVMVKSSRQGKFRGNEFNCEEWGLSIQEITPRIVKNFQLDSEEGILISSVKSGSKGDKAEIRPGEVLLSVDDVKILNLDDFKTKYENYRQSEKSFLLFLRSGQTNRFALIKGEME